MTISHPMSPSERFKMSKAGKKTTQTSNKKNTASKHQSRETHNTVPVNESKKVKSEFKFDFHNPRIRLGTAFLLAVVVYLLLWTDAKPDSVDPWYRAFKLVDSATRVENPIQKQMLLNTGGNSLKELSVKYPYHSKIQLMLGIYYNIVGQFDSAITVEKEAIILSTGGTINPVEQDAQRQLLYAVFTKANNLLNSGNYVDAKKTIDTGVKYVPNNADLMSLVGAYYHRKGSLDSARLYYNAVLSVNPQNEFARTNLGMLVFQEGNQAYTNGQLETALTNYKRAAELNPKNADALSNVGIVYSRKNNYKDAIPFFQRALDVDPRHNNSISGLITAYIKTGDERSAEAVKRKYGIK